MGHDRFHHKTNFPLCPLAKLHNETHQYQLLMSDFASLQPFISFSSIKIFPSYLRPSRYMLVSGSYEKIGVDCLKFIVFISLLILCAIKKGILSAHTSI